MQSCRIDSVGRPCAQKRARKKVNSNTDAFTGRQITSVCFLQKKPQFSNKLHAQANNCVCVCVVVFFERSGMGGWISVKRKIKSIQNLDYLFIYLCLRRRFYACIKGTALQKKEKSLPPLRALKLNPNRTGWDSPLRGLERSLWVWVTARQE